MRKQESMTHAREKNKTGETICEKEKMANLRTKTLKQLFKKCLKNQRKMWRMSGKLCVN